MNFENPIAPILKNCREQPERAALEFAERTFSYGELEKEARRIAAALKELSEKPAIGIFAQRSPLAYCGILGTLIAGKSFVPLNPSFPLERTRYMIERAELDTILCDGEYAELITELPEGSLSSIKLLFPDEKPKTSGNAQCFALRELGSGTDERIGVERSPEDTAYIMFTSGSTGSPKQIKVKDRNLLAWLKNSLDLFRPKKEDRFSQTFDLTFDLSVHDIFLSLASGGTLCIPEDPSPLRLHRYIREREPTIWFSVPSVALLMDKMKVLRDNAFPSLRMSLFCGEALSYGLARAWKRAAPASQLHNLYGPTEATIAISSYRPEEQELEKNPSEGILPIGKPFPGHSARIVDDEENVVKKGAVGELCLKGPQVTEAGKNGRFGEEAWHCSGDLVVEGESGVLEFKGRKDDQVKVQGYRVSLLEVENALRRVAGAQEVAVVRGPNDQGGVRLYGFVSEGSGQSPQELHRRLREVLPWYMLPTELLTLKEFPLNPNGKTDRNELYKMLKTDG